VEPQGAAGDDPDARAADRVLRHRGRELPHRRDGRALRAAQAPPGDREAAGDPDGGAPDRHGLRGLGRRGRPRGRRNGGRGARGGGAAGAALPAALQPLAQPHRDALAARPPRGRPLRAGREHASAARRRQGVLRALQPTPPADPLRHRLQCRESRL
ncbi:MAG: hypothetical protein AVDCRST_MAG59-2594, partial [uncultured Thermomicrobiales bacterium]